MDLGPGNGSMFNTFLKMGAYVVWKSVTCGAAFMALLWLCCYVAALALCWRRFGALLGSAGGELRLCRRCARLATSFSLY